jgi:hypothetical protein
MPIKYWVDNRRRLVMAKGAGTLTEEDVFGYQRDVWSQPELTGYNELVDMSQVEDITLPSVERLRELARLSAGMDAPSSESRFAIVAPTQLHFALGRMYKIYRGLDERSTKKVRVFLSLDEAFAFLDGSDGSEQPRI